MVKIIVPKNEQNPLYLHQIGIAPDSYSQTTIVEFDLFLTTPNAITKVQNLPDFECEATGYTTVDVGKAVVYKAKKNGSAIKCNAVTIDGVEKEFTIAYDKSVTDRVTQLI